MNSSNLNDPNDLNSAANSADIKRVYAQRDATKGDLYAYYQEDVALQMAQRNWALAAFLKQAFGKLDQRSFLDVGCGDGLFLRQLINWGGRPDQCTGTELLLDRLAQARSISPAGVTWHQGGLESLPNEQEFDLVSAFTVFSSILDPELRRYLADQMWARVKPGGWVLIFDFRWNNPKNPNVRKVTSSELADWWPCQKQWFQSLFLAPPLARRIAPISLLLAQLFEAMSPFLRSHFLFGAQKPG